MSGERLAAARERAQRNGFGRHLGIEVDDAREGYLILASRPPGA